MLGMAKTQELWRAREEMGTRSWTSKKFLQKWDVIQSLRKNEKAFAGHILRDRIETWKACRGCPEEQDSQLRSCEMDIIGNALDDICLLEAEIGGHGVLDMLIRNECWQEERLLLRKFLDRVESQRLKKQKGISKKNDFQLQET